MGRRRKSPAARAAAAKRRKQKYDAQQKKIDNMSYREYEDFVNSDAGKQAAKLEGGQFFRNQPGMLSKNQIESRTRELGLKRGSKEYQDFVRKHTPRTQQDILKQKRRAYEDSLVSKDNLLNTAKEVAQGQMQGQGGSPKGQMGAVAQAGKALAGAAGEPQQGAAPMSPKAGGAPKGQAQDP